MREFFFNDASKVLDDPKVVQALAALYEYKGKQVLYLQAHLDIGEAPERLWQITRGRRIATSRRSRGTATYLPSWDCGGSLGPRFPPQSQMRSSY